MKKTALFLSVLFLASCTSNTIYKKPKDLIPKDTMVALLTDLFIANSASGEKNIFLEKKVNYMPLLYRHYKIDSVRYKKSNFYYLTKVDVYNEMYKKVLKNLEEKRKALDSLFKKQHDSLSKKKYEKLKEKGN